MSWLSKTYKSTVGWSHLEDLVDLGGRLGGTESERQAAELTRDALMDAGARNGRIDTFDIQGWFRGSSSINAGDGETEYDCFALPRSPAGRVVGELVNVGHGGPADFDQADLDGAVVMAGSSQPPDAGRNIHRREKYRMAVDNGAAAFIFRNHMDGCLPRSGTVGGTDGGVGDIPAVAVSKETGLRLDRQAGGESVSVDVDATIEDAESGNVRAELGPATDDRIIVSSHVDGHDVSESAHDDGVGTATVVEIANILADREDDLDTRVEFVTFGAEELGLIGSAHYVATEDLDNIKAVIQNDGISRARDLRLHTNGFDRLRSPAETVAARYDQPIHVHSSLRLSSDHWRFVDQGVPAFYAGSDSTADEQVFGSSNGIILTPADTIDKLDVRDLRNHAILESELVVELADSDRSLPHVDQDVIADRLEAENKSFKAEIYRREGP
ncbi:MAG: M28 family peptidase, partial [Halobacteriales archaeon]|nr:M28 family peptidase [Halobacteriales archaeon]